MDYPIKRIWAMPNKDTFSCPPIGEFVKSYLAKSKVSVDVFARNKRWATYTNDLNPNTLAEYHMTSDDFLAKLLEDGVVADLVIFDPPFSPGQLKDSYESFGLKMAFKDGQLTHGWTTSRDTIVKIQPDNGVCLSFGWNSGGMGINRGYEILEILLCNHGSGHPDTICMAERKIPNTIQEFK